jgi:hypothetical protein
MNGEILPLLPLRGTVFELDVLACALTAFHAPSDTFRTCSPPPDVPSVPMDMIDNDLPCFCLVGSAALFSAALPSCKVALLCRLDAAECVARCPFFKCAGILGPYDEFLDAAGGLFEVCIGVTLRWLDAPFFWGLRDGDLSPFSCAMFLNVMVHSTCSPANTVDLEN